MRYLKLLLLVLSLCFVGLQAHQSRAYTLINPYMSYPAAGGGGGETFKYWSKNSPTLTFSSTIGNGGDRWAVAASSTRVIIYSVSEDAWWVVDKSGGSWSVTGWDNNPAPTTSTIDLCANSSTRVYLADATNDNLKAYDIDGSGNFTELASQALTAGNNTTIACNSNEDVAVYDQTNNTFWVYSYSASSFTLDETDAALVSASSSGGNMTFTSSTRIFFQNGNFNLGAIDYISNNLAADGGNKYLVFGGGTNLATLRSIPGDNDSISFFRQNQGGNGDIVDGCTFGILDYDGTDFKVNNQGIMRFFMGDSGVVNCPLRDEVNIMHLSSTEIAIVDRTQGKMTSYELVDKAYQSTLSESSAQLYVDLNNPLSFDSSSDSQTLSDLINSHDFHFGASSSPTTDDPAIAVLHDQASTNTFAYLSKSGTLSAESDGGDGFLLKTITSTFLADCHKDDTNDCWYAFLGDCQRGNHTMFGSGNSGTDHGIQVDEGNADDFQLTQHNGTSDVDTALDVNNLCSSGQGSGLFWYFISFDADGTTNNVYYYMNNSNFAASASATFGSSSTDPGGFALMAVSNTAGTGFTDFSSADDMFFMAFAAGNSFINTNSTIEGIRAEMMINARIIDPYDW